MCNANNQLSFRSKMGVHSGVGSPDKMENLSDNPGNDFYHSLRSFNDGRLRGQIMVHPGGFEPPTARFVAGYSIQLSYGCSTNGGEGGIRTLDAAFDRILP